MPDPVDTAAFNSTEHFQSVCRQVVNKLIREDFRDINSTTDITDIASARTSLRRACWHEDDDSFLMTVGKLLMYYMVCGKARRLHPAIYGLPKQDYDQDVKYRPQLFFYFAQDSQAVPDGFDPITARIHIRLMNETVTTINPTKARALATEIKRVFITRGQGKTWSKGKVIVDYKDKNDGFSIRLYVISKDEGIKVIKMFLDILNRSYNDDYLTEHNPEKSSINNPTGTSTIYGQQVSNSRWRPTGKVRFIYASLQIKGLDDDKILIDTRDPYDGLIVV